MYQAYTFQVHSFLGPVKYIGSYTYHLLQYYKTVHLFHVQYYRYLFVSWPSFCWDDTQHMLVLI